MAQRLEFHNILRTLADNVYFQPPENIQIQYPCIVYKRDTAITEFADNLPHMSSIGYEVTIIDRDPDSLILGKVSALPMCLFDRHFVADSLNHDVFKIHWKGMAA